MSNPTTKTELSETSVHPITVVPHRGIHDHFPENSMGAFDAARGAGFDWIEFDVWSSADGLPVIMHDETLDRTAEGTGLIADKSSRELQEIYLKGDRGLEQVPVGLNRLLHLSSGGMLIEVKPPDAKKLVELIITSIGALKSPWMLQSFAEENLIHGWSVDPGAPAALLVEKKEELERAIQKRWPAIHACHELLDEGLVQKMRDAGIGVGAWTVNEEDDVRRIVRLRPDKIITDVPRRVRRVIREMSDAGVCEAARVGQSNS